MIGESKRPHNFPHSVGDFMLSSGHKVVYGKPVLSKRDSFASGCITGATFSVCFILDLQLCICFMCVLPFLYFCLLSARGFSLD